MSIELEKRRANTSCSTIWTCLATGLFWVVFAACSTPVAAQVAPPPLDKAAIERRDLIKAANQHLRDNDVAMALKSLAKLAETAKPISLLEADDISSTCAGLHRALVQLSSQEQFDVLSKWSMPADSPNKIRVLTALVPTDAPPAEFSRALGERPRGNSFSIASIGSVRGIYSTHWSLVVAARDCGRLKRLMTELGPLVDQKVPGAALLLSLATIAAERGDVSKVAEQIANRIAQLNGSGRPAGPTTLTIETGNVLVATAALTHRTLRPLGEEFFSALLASIVGQPAPYVRPFLRQAHAIACLLLTGARDESDVALMPASNLKYWLPVSRGSDRSNCSGTSTSSWLVHEDHVLHLSGSSNDALLLRFPLTGDFRFQFETQLGGRFETDGGVTYGGLGFQAVGSNGEFRVKDFSGKILEKRYCPFAHRAGPPAFHRLSVSATANSATVAVDRHPMWVAQSGFQASPWLGLTSLGESRPMFRNFKMTGHPIIPRTVRLSDGDELQGWQPQVWGNGTNSQTKIESDWRVANGVIGAPGHTSAAGMTKLEQRLLSYERPLLDGESVSYEFFHEPGLIEVSPALGRVAFLLQPEGVRIHWVTEDDDWTSIPTDNTIVEPLCRRGPRPLPFKMKDWNRLSLNRVEQDATLSLNDVVIYQRPIDWERDHRFGLYRHGANTDVKVRDVVLTGDWPQELPQDFLDNPTATVGNPIVASHRLAFDKIFQAEFLASNVIAVCRQARSMQLDERFNFLSQWILPGQNHPGIRMAGEFMPTQSAPIDVEAGINHGKIDGQIVSPVFDWIDAANQLGRLAECHQRVKAIVPGDDNCQQRARASLLLMLNLEMKDPAANDGEWDVLIGLLKQETNIESENHWPEMLLAVRGGTKFPESAPCTELISYLAVQRMLRWKGPDVLRRFNHLGALYGQILSRRENAAEVFAPDEKELHEWISVTAGRAVTVGSGYPQLKWSRHGGSVVKDAGHDIDYLYYHLPLDGDFQVECDLIQSTQIPVSVMVAGTYAGLLGGLNGIENGSFRAGAPPIMFEPALTNMANLAKPIRYRAVVHEGTQTIYFNGRKVLDVSLPAVRDPWIAIRSEGRHHSRVRNFQILGKPKVLDAVELSTSNDLTGWLNYHEEGSWTHVDKPDSAGWIIGHSNPAYAGSFTESLLRYQRPLVEDGSIEYEFFYEPGVAETHPAFDRLVFLLDPSGIREHRITDGRYSLIESAPDNLADVPGNRRGPAELPLLAGKWNRTKLSLRGAILSLELNGQQVYERILESDNQRAFGLFHYVDVTEARVRNVVMRGNWPKSLPPVSGQDLAGKTLDWLDADLPRLTSVFTHRFDKAGVPERFFQTYQTTTSNCLTETPEGARVIVSSTKESMYFEIYPRFSLSGDFDIETSFEQLNMTNRAKSCQIMFRLRLDAPQKPCYDWVRMVNLPAKQMLHAAQVFSAPTNPGADTWRAETDGCEADSGRMRIARRGKKLFYLFAEAGSERFRLYHTEEASEADILRHGIHLQTATTDGNIKVTWKNIQLRAERMTWYPPPPKTNLVSLKVIQADGRGMRTIATPATLGFTALGSPEWSSDGRKIALDMSNGTTATSHIVVIDADGTDLQDLGPGCMPSFSRDGERIAFSQPGLGIMTMKSDGTDRQQVDGEGWGTQWSPDGKWIAYGKTGNITLLNVATRETRQVLEGDSATRYGDIYWNLSWSHDSKWIAFKGRTRAANEDELAVAEIHSPDGFKVLKTNAAAVHPDITFSPDSEKVIAIINNGGDLGPKLYAFSRKEPASPELVDFMPADQAATSVAWSRDGKTISFTTLEQTQPMAWVTGLKSGDASK